MQRKIWIGLGAAALLATVPLVGSSPVAAKLVNTLAAAVQQKPVVQPQVVLNLVGERQTITKNAEGKEVVTWQSLGQTVQPGDRLRFVLNGQNKGDRPAANLVLTQPIPKGTQYTLNTAMSTAATQITYSIDSGKTFVANPTVPVTLANGTVTTQPAPASAYTHVRWTVAQPLVAQANLQATYQVTVR
jgi:uncharacterized repeat protein (TIGR01451 family)